MQSVVAKRLYRAFDSAFRKMLPMFVHVSAGPNRHEVRLYEWKPLDDVSIYLKLIRSHNSDAFTWEAAWSTKHAYPWHLYPMSPLGNKNAKIPREEPVDGEFMFRITELWDIGKDPWWHVRGDHEISDLSLDEFLKEDWANFSMPSYTDEQIASVVDAVISRIKLDVLPFVKVGISKMLGTNISLSRGMTRTNIT